MYRYQLGSPSHYLTYSPNKPMANRYYYSHFRSRGIEAHRHMHYHKELTSELQRQDMCLEKKATNSQQ